jgi:hypothetical protein
LSSSASCGNRCPSFLLVGVFASAAVQRYVFGHATAEFVDVVLFVVLGALFTATIARLASVLTLMPVATLLSISSGWEGRGRAARARGGRGPA